MTVTTRSSTGAMQTYESDLLLCTVSLGVLKSNAIAWEPPLPKWKQDAVEKLGFGLLNKCVMEFEQAFWTNHVCYRILLASHVKPAFPLLLTCFAVTLYLYRIHLVV